MIRHLLSISFCAGLFTALIALSGCGCIDCPVPPKKKGIVALVYTDLTKSINDETANRQKRNIEELFQSLPYDSKFYVFSIDRGTNKPSIYEFLPKFIEPKTPREEDQLTEEIATTKKAKESTELEKLRSSLDSYHAAIISERGPVSCISNKLNSLTDMIAIKRSSVPEYEIRLYFYSDMIEQCQNSFDGKPLTFEKYPDDTEEAKHLQDIQKRIEANFQPANPNKNLKSMGTAIQIILTSQDDKQSLRTLKTLWNSFFGKLGLSPEDIVWANGNEECFWKLNERCLPLNSSTQSVIANESL
jgi:hypothetical protein